MTSETKKINKIVYYHRTLQESDLDSFNVISGYKGFGKSNLAFVGAFDYLRHFGCKCPKCKYTWVYTKKVLHDIDNLRNYKDKCKKCKTITPVGIKWDQFGIEDLWKYVAYDAGDIYDKIMKLEEGSPLCADEAVNFAMGEDWMFQANKRVKNLIAKCRTKHLIVFMNIPKFSWLQSKYRDDMSSGWFRILRRGLAIFLIPDLGEAQDSWHLKDFEKYLGSYTIMTSKEELMRKIQILKKKHPCFFDSFWIPRFPDRLYKMYKRIRHYYVFQKEAADIDRPMFYKLMCYNLRFNWKQLIQMAKDREHPSARMVHRALLYNPGKKKCEISEIQVKQAVTEMKKIFVDMDAHEDIKAYEKKLDNPLD